VNGKALRQTLGLSETATDDEVTTKLNELKARPVPPAPPAPDPLSTASVEDVLKQLTDLQGNPGVKALAELVKAQQTQLTRLDGDRKKAQIERQLDELDRGKAFSVPPVVKERLREVLEQAPEGLGKEVFEAYQKTLEIGLIDMSERGWQRRGGDQSPTTLYLTEVDQLMTSSASAGRKMSYADAAMQVARTNPQLAAQYREDSYIDEGR
jgi:hypothetical protein